MWWARPADARPWLVAWFNDDERERLAALRRPIDRDRFTVGCGLLRLLAGAYLGQPPAKVPVSRRCRRCGKAHGRPRLGSPSLDLELSVSHAGDRVVVACGRGLPVGVDVEPLRYDVEIDRLIDLVASPSEAHSLTALGPYERARAFLVSWTRKEAVLKATGQGLTVPLSRVVVSTPEDPPRLIAWPAWLGDASAVSLHDLDPGPGHVATLAVLGGCTELVTQDGSALLAREGLNAEG